MWERNKGGAETPLETCMLLHKRTDNVAILVTNLWFILLLSLSSYLADSIRCRSFHHLYHRFPLRLAQSPPRIPSTKILS